MPELERILKVHHAHKPPELIEQEAALDPEERFTERDLILITYADAVRSREATGIEALHRFVETYYDSINTIHMLPFFPYSSDRGFAVVDFKAVDPKVGHWDQVRELAFDYDLMFDAVFNHASSRSEMFRGFLRGDPQYDDFFIAYDSPDDLTAGAAQQDLPAAHVGHPDALRDHRRAQVHLDDLLARPDRLQLPQPAGAAGGARGAALLRPARRRHHPPRRGHLPVVRARAPSRSTCPRRTRSSSCCATCSTRWRRAWPS